MNTTILTAISVWAVKNWGITESLANVGKEVLAKVLFDPLKERIIRFFDKEEDADSFVEQITETTAVNPLKPCRDVEDVYEEICGKSPDDELFQAIARFMADNQEMIRQINNQGVIGRQIVNEGIYVGTQNAKMVNNIKGNLYINCDEEMEKR